MYDYNLLVSHGRGLSSKARREILALLEELGDGEPRVERTLARGVLGVRTVLDPFDIVHRLRTLYKESPELFAYCLKWIPVDRWTFSDIKSMKVVVEELRDKIGEDEKWRMTVEKRRYTILHSSEVIRELASLIDRKVDLEDYDKELRVDIFGRYAGLSVLRKGDIFSLAAPYG
jgi:tRNA(Ser,Leu) C12 N-acetylase TAN1